MGSRSKQGRKRTTGSSAGFGSEDVGTDYWRKVYDVIKLAQDDKQLTWTQRALLFTQFPKELPRLCKRHGMPGAEKGFIMVIRRLVLRERLECFDRDALNKLLRLLNTLVKARTYLLNSEAALTRLNALEQKATT